MAWLGVGIGYSAIRACDVRHDMAVMANHPTI